MCHYRSLSGESNEVSTLEQRNVSLRKKWKSRPSPFLLNTDSRTVQVLFLSSRFENLVSSRFNPLLSTILKLHERQAWLILRQCLLEVLKIDFDGFAIYVFKFHL